MSQIGIALRRFALENEYLAEQLGERLRPVHLEQGDEDAIVAATYVAISAVPDESLEDDCGHTQDRIQFDVYSNDEALGERVAQRLRLRLLKAYGTLVIEDADTPTTIYCTGVSTAGGVRDLSALQPDDGSGDWKHRISFDMAVGYNPAI